MSNTSRLRFLEFLKRYRSRTLADDIEDEDSAKSEGKQTSAKSGKDETPEEKRKNKKKRRAYLRLYIRQLWPHRGLVIFLIVLSLLMAGLDVIQPLFMRYIIDQVLLNTDLESAQKLLRLNFVGLLFLAAVLISQGLGIGRSYQQHLLNMRVILTLRRALFDRMLRLPLDKLSDMKTGGIISRLTDDVNTTTGLLQMAVISPGVAIARLLIAVGILFALNWRLALTAIGIIPCVMLISMIAIRRIRPIYRSIRKDVSFVDGRVGEAFQGIRAVRAFLGERREEHEYTLGHHTITRMRMFARRRELILWGSWGFLLALINLVIIWAGGYMQIFGSASIGDIMAFQWYSFMLLNPVWQIVESFSELQRSLASMERVFEVLESPVDKPDRPTAGTAPREVTDIRFDNVWFAYDDENYVISNFDLNVTGGSTIALVGRSGAGKTTITDLIARFYDPTRGAILLNGVDLRDIKLASYREMLGIVQQEVFLFDGTVRENISYANRAAAMEDVIEVAKRANAHEFIIDLPKGYDSMIGERGVKLSGGQRQRLSIARAFLADSRILILDEATSNLDTESEQLIQQSMLELLKDRTTFVIAHRLSTITHADQIVVLESGEIVEIGSHSALMAGQGHYAEMIRRQQESIESV